MRKFKIFIKDFRFSTIVGILEHERVTPQEVIVEAEIEYVKVEEFIDYAEVCEIIKDLMINKKYLLLEDALEEIADVLKKEYKEITKIKLSITKSEILKNALVGVEFLREY